MLQEEWDQLMLAAFRIQLAASPDMIFIKDANFAYQAASDRFVRLVGYAHGTDLAGKTDPEIYPPNLAKKYTDDDQRILESGVNVENFIEPLPDQGEETVYSSTSKYVIRGADGTFQGFFGVSKDVTVEVALESERERGSLARRMFDSVLEADLTEDRVLRIEGTGWVERLSQAMSGASFTQAIAFMNSEFIHPDHAQEFLRYYDLERLRADHAQAKDEFKHMIYVHNGLGYRWVEFRTRVYYSRASGTLRVTSFVRDVDEDVRQRQSLQQKASTDPLTGLHNRASMLEQVGGRLTQWPGSPNATLFIDLDNFKQVNDHWGHHVGDAILQETARRLQELFGSSALLGRIGGDEFLVFLPDIDDEEMAREQIREAAARLAFHHQEEGEDLYVTYSVGAAICRGGDASVGELCRQADVAMYRAKAEGRNRVFFFAQPCQGQTCGTR